MLVLALSENRSQREPSLWRCGSKVTSFFETNTVPQWGRDGQSAINNVKQLFSNGWDRTVNVTVIFGSEEVTSSISQLCASPKSCRSVSTGGSAHFVLTITNATRGQRTGMWVTSLFPKEDKIRSIISHAE